MSTPSPSTPWVPIWDLIPPPIVPTPINGKWLTVAGGAMIWQDIPGLVAPDAAWTVMSLTNAWVHYVDPYGPGRYRKLPSGLVVCNGLVQSGTVNTVAFTFPVGYRPAPQVNGAYRDHIFQCAQGGGVSNESARLDSNGALRFMNAFAQPWIDLSGIMFWAP